MSAVEVLPPVPQAVMARERQAADILGLDRHDLQYLQSGHVESLGEIAVGGVSVPAYRAHAGAPEEAIRREEPTNIAKGGIKASAKYATVELALSDLWLHARDMNRKTGAIGQTDHVGGKAWIGMATNLATRDFDTAWRYMQEFGKRMGEAGLAHHFVDVPAGDEGTNLLIPAYLAGVKDYAPHPEAAVTGKNEMTARPAATGKGAVYVHLERMELQGREHMGAVVHGFGFAGGFYASEATRLARENAEGEGPRITIQAIGDVRVIDEHHSTPTALWTSDVRGLPVDQDMVEALVCHPGEDKDLAEAMGNKLLALGVKIRRRYPEVELDYHEGTDVLELASDMPAVGLVVPASTSNVVTEEVAKRLRPDQIVGPIANNAYCTGVLQTLHDRGVQAASSALDSAGGVYLSIREHQGDCNRIAFGSLWQREDDATLERDLRKTMVEATRCVERVVRLYDVDYETAVTVVGLGRHAVARGMRVTESLRDLLAA